MQRRNRPQDDKETVSRSDTTPPLSTSHRQKQSRRRTRPQNHGIKNVRNLFPIMLCILLVFVIVHYLASTRMGTAGSTNRNRALRSHDRHHGHRETSYSLSDLHKTFNQSADCPLDPIPGYPMQFNLLQMLETWPIDDEARHDTSYHSLCVFQWSKARDREKMERYRKLELPFIIAGDPQVLEGKRLDLSIRTVSFET
mmetsp:Transcript_36466/g.88326  ORF Transcript_36466/g.88326 Transcript_36466/m.88326 type:complete len:198 (+) Transcript_36466:3034-3627(+)